MSGERVVTGESGARYRLDSLIGRGGQGAVYSTPERSRAVKVLSSGHDAAVLRERIARVRRLPLEDLPIAHPLELLRSPHIGYAMEQILGLAPLSSLIAGNRDQSLKQWYISSGGLRHRLRCLTLTSRLFAALHGRGLVYGDPSPANILVPGKGARGAVWLIDPDNLHYASSGGGFSVHTPRYAAPELARRDGGATFATDQFSLAVMIFESLTLIHPLLGDSVIDGAPSQEMAALQGELPWVDDPSDSTNRTNRGIQRACVLTSRLQSLAARAFANRSRDTAARPTAAAWAEALQDAWGQSLECQCGGGMYADDFRCHWCDAPRPAHLRCELQSSGKHASLQFLLQSGSTVSVALDGRPVDPSTPELGALLLRLDNEALSVQGRNGYSTVFADSASGKSVAIGSHAFRIDRSMIAENRVSLTILSDTTTHQLSLRAAA